MPSLSLIGTIMVIQLCAFRNKINILFWLARFTKNYLLDFQVHTNCKVDPSITFSDVNFTVTDAMKKDLVNNFGATNVHILYDQPHPRFKSLTENQKELFFSRLSKSYPLLEKVKLGAKLIVSSTSWTKDEDFSILLDALGMTLKRPLNFGGYLRPSKQVPIFVLRP